MKRRVNWWGYTLIGTYILILVLLLFLGIAMDRQEKLSIRNVFYGVTLGWFLLMVPLSYVTLNKTWYKLLPEIKSNVTVVKKEVKYSSENIGGDLYSSKRLYTFHLSCQIKSAWPFPQPLNSIIP